MTISKDEEEEYREHKKAEKQKEFEVFKGWVAKTNTDCNEGRGKERPLFFTLRKSTAIRLGKGKYIQGGNCPVDCENFIRYDNDIYVKAEVEEPSLVDIDSEKKDNEIIDLRIKLGDSFDDVYKIIREDLERTK